jgi:hypothetical protein
LTLKKWRTTVVLCYCQCIYDLFYGISKRSKRTQHQSECTPPSHYHCTHLSYPRANMSCRGAVRCDTKNYAARACQWAFGGSEMWPGPARILHTVRHGTSIVWNSTTSRNCHSQRDDAFALYKSPRLSSVNGGPYHDRFIPLYPVTFVKPSPRIFDRESVGPSTNVKVRFKVTESEVDLASVEKLLLQHSRQTIQDYKDS